jgi:hypothetical protein
MRTVKRVMGEICFLHAAEAEAVGAKIRKAGFNSKITDDVDEASDDTRFMMVWSDTSEGEYPDRSLKEFAAKVDAIVQDPRNPIDCVGFVYPDHVPAHFGDYGKRRSA